MSCRLGIDVGGTFTDLLLLNEQGGAVRVLKTPSTPDDPSAAVIAGAERLIAEANIAPGDIAGVRFASTVAAEIVRRRTGARVGLLVTENFEQVLHLARGETPGPQNGWLTMPAPAALADLEFTRGVPERMNARGEVMTPVDEAAARQAVQELVDGGVDAICISLLHAYANAAHERRLRDIVHEIDDAMPVTLSSETRREAGEYERTLVTLANAYAGPGVRRHLGEVAGRLKGLGGSPQFSVMRADGGATGVDQAAAAPMAIVAAGPAGAIAAATRAARAAGIADAFTFDMGGFSTDLSLITDGAAPVGRQIRVRGLPVRAAAMDIDSIGAGGSAVAHVPMTGALRVGPDSAGAVPGPACYGRGGSRATLTDANLVLGRLPAALLGGGMQLDVKAAEEAVGRIARALDVDLHRAAQGIVDVANERIVGSLRRLAVRRAIAPSDAALIAFGGAGPMHANAVAALIGCYPVLVPLHAGTLSAAGCVQAGLRNEFVQAVVRDLAELSDGRIGELLAKLAGYARAGLAADGAGDDRQQLSFEADLRYLGQSRELSLPVQQDALTGTGVRDLAERFAVLHERRHGFRPDLAVELVNLRVIGRARADAVEAPRTEGGGDNPSAAMLDQRRVHFDGEGINTNVYDRRLLTPGHVLRGPAVVVQADTTTVVHPRHTARIDDRLNILISPDSASA